MVVVVDGITDMSDMFADIFAARREQINKKETRSRGVLVQPSLAEAYDDASIHGEIDAD